MRVLIAGEVAGRLDVYRREVEGYVGVVDVVVSTRGLWRYVPLFIASALRGDEVVATSFLWFLALFRPTAYVFLGDLVEATYWRYWFFWGDKVAGLAKRVARLFEFLSWALGSGVVTISVDVYRRLGGRAVLMRPSTPPLQCPNVLLPRRYVLYVGRLSAEKGIGDLVKAAVRLRSCRFVIVGDGPLRFLAERAGRLPNVAYVGPVPREELWRLYKSALALVLPSYTESWGHVVTEARMCGVPHIFVRRGTAASMRRGVSVFDDLGDLLRLLEPLCEDVVKKDKDEGGGDREH